MSTLFENTGWSCAVIALCPRSMLSPPSLQGCNTAGDSGSERRRHPNYSQDKAISSHNPNYFSLIILTNCTFETGTYPENWAKPMDATGESVFPLLHQLKSNEWICLTVAFLQFPSPPQSLPSWHRSVSFHWGQWNDAHFYQLMI